MKTLTTKCLEEIRNDIKTQISYIDGKLYSDSIITVNLEMTRDKFGEEAKNKLIDEFGLEEYGWRKEVDVIKRYGELHLNKPPKSKK